MKHKRRLASGILSIILAMSPIAGSYAYGASLGDMLFSKSIPIGESTTLANGVYWNSNLNDKVVENYMQFVPGGDITPKITYGNDIYGAASFKAVATKAEAEGDHVIAGLNGDYFTMSNGVAMGMTIKDGILRTSERGSYPSIGFRTDGTAIIGEAGLNILLTGASLGAGIGHIHLNKVVTAASGLMLYTTDFGDDDTNKAAIPTYNVLLNVISGEPKINGTIQVTVDSVSQSNGAVKIPEGKLLLTMAATTDYPGTLSKFMALLPGDSLTLSFGANTEWNDVTYAVGGGVKLITGGANVAPATSDVDPRTAIGIKADGSMIYYTVDGRQTGTSMGATLYQVAQRLLELGCVEALNMDGGGSTAVHAIYPGDSGLTNVNIPSEGSLRSCANYILLVNTENPTGNLNQLFLYPYATRMLAGATQTFATKATDQNYYAVTPPTSISYSASSGLGTIDSNGLFTAGPASKVGEITAKSGGKSSNPASVTVVAKPDSISVVNSSDSKTITSLTVNAGDVVDLSAQAIYQKLPLIAQDTCFNWSVTGAVGTIDNQGRFTVGNLTNGSGTISVAAGGTQTTLAVKVVSEGQRLESFEAVSSTLQAAGVPGLTLAMNRDLPKVRYGYQSVKLDYDFSAAGAQMITIPTSLSFTKTPDTFSMWVYGDGSGTTMNLVFGTNSGNQELIGTTLGEVGWKQVVVATPAGSKGLSAIKLIATGQTKGTVYLDQMISGIGYYVDQEPPTITMSLSGTAITASVEDSVDSGLAATDMKVTFDGQPLAFQYNPNTYTVTATLPAVDGLPHKVALTVSDESGNLARSSVYVPAVEGASEPFLDMTNHWAKASTSYLYSRGIVNGVTTANGLTFNPDRNLTRAEFAVLMSNWLGGDGTQYANVELPFADTANIPSWALDAVKTMYGMGVIKGIGIEGILYFKPGSPISREEVMTIIGRTQIRGFGEANLTIYQDGNQVSGWAEPYVKTLVQQGVVSGYDGKLWPKNLVTRAQVSAMITGLN